MFAACSAGPENKPLEPKKMEDILLDVHLAESYSELLPIDTLGTFSGKNADSLALYYKEIFAKHNITLQQWNSSLEWYRNHPKEMDSIYAHLIPRMGELETRARVNH